MRIQYWLLLLLLCFRHGLQHSLSYSVVVITLDFESSNLGSNPGRTFFFSQKEVFVTLLLVSLQFLSITSFTPSSLLWQKSWSGSAGGSGGGPRITFESHFGPRYVLVFLNS